MRLMRHMGPIGLMRRIGLMRHMGPIGLMGFMGFYVILLTTACFCGKAAGSGDEALPNVARQGGQVVAPDAFPDEGTGETGVEAVACAYGTHYLLDARGLDVEASRRGADADQPCAGRAEEVGAEGADVPIIYITRVARAEHHFDVIGTAAHDGAPPQVLLDG